MQSYSVMKDPVIPVALLDGSQEEIGIREIFLRAHEIEDIQCQSPLEQYAVFRLLIAIAMDMLHPERWRDRKDLFEQGHFDPNTIDAYIAECEKNGPCFDLFDREYPFMQTVYDTKTDSKMLKPVSVLTPSLPSGNNHIFLDHRMESMPVMTPAEAFRSMLTLYVFCTAGAQGYPSGVNNTPPVYNIIIGRTLFESIVLNMVSVKEYPEIEYGLGTVPWRAKKPVIPKKEFGEITLLEGMTWQPRRLCLLRDTDNLVRQVSLQQGNNFRGNDLWQDPHIAYRRNKTGEWSSIKPQAGRALWRDISALLADSAKAHYHPPLTISRAADILESNETPLIIRQIGVITNQASYVSWVEDQLSIPEYLLVNELLSSIIREDVSLIESIQGILVNAINRQFCSDPKRGTADIAEQARLRFLAEAHDILFGFCIPDLYQFQQIETTEAINHHLNNFHQKTKDAIQHTFLEVVSAACASARQLQLAVEAQREVINKYRKIKTEREEIYG